jgi:hypothetical protein
MKLHLKTGWRRNERFALLEDGVAVEEDWWFLHHRGHFRYRQLRSQTVRESRSFFWPVTIFLVLLSLPVFFFWVSTLGGDFEAFWIAGVLFCIPALILLREMYRRTGHTLLFLERGDGGVAIRLYYRSAEAESVESFAKELQRRITGATQGNRKRTTSPRGGK